MIKLIQGDCLEKMRDIPDNSIDLILTDPPYGITACKWDNVINLKKMWAEIKRIKKIKCSIVMFSAQPFTSVLIQSNIKMFKYTWVWEKDQGVNFQNCKTQPLKNHEDICVFSGDSHFYYPQGLIDCKIEKSNAGKERKCDNPKDLKNGTYIQTKKGYPKSVQKFNRETGIHPTQKPVKLMEYLIKTYTNKSEYVLDFTMGSGTTGVACKLQRRNFIGIELDEDYFKIAEKRISSINAIQNEIEWE